MKSFTTILAAVDFSENSDLAFDYAESLATAFNASLVVMHVIDNLVYAPGFDMPYPFIEDLDKDLKGAERCGEHHRPPSPGEGDRRLRGRDRRRDQHPRRVS